MFKQKRGFVSLLVLMLVFTQIISPVTALGFTLEKPDEIHLYKTSDNVEIEEGIFIEPGSYVYGSPAEENVRIQFKDTEVEIPAAVLEIVETEEADVPPYHSVPELSSAVDTERKLGEGTKLYHIDVEAEVGITIAQEIDYPVYQNEYGLEVIYLGNLEFYLNEEDRLIALNMQEAPVAEEGTNHDAETEEDLQNETNNEQEEQPNTDVDNEDTPETPKEENAEESPSQAQVEESKAKEHKNAEIEREKSPSLENHSALFSTFSVAVDPWKGKESVKYFRADSNVAVYDNRGGGPLKKVGELVKGQVYPRVSDYGNWHRIDFGSFYGYVRKSETSPASGNAIKNENKNYKDQSRTFTALKDVTVYDNTSGKLVPFGTIDKGQTYPIASDYGNWWRVIFSDRVGYVRKSDVQIGFTKSDKYFRADNNVAVYDNRGGGPLKKVGELVKGQVYPRVSDYGNWHRIDFGNFYGYVKKSETSPASGSAIKNENKKYKDQSRTFTALKDVTVYDNTSGKLVPFGKIDKGQRFPIAADYGKWWIILYSDRVGYIKKEEVKVQVKSTDKYFRVFNNLPVYDNRTGSLKKVGELVKGQSYPIHSDYGNWWRVKFGNIYGYVRKSDTGYATKSEIPNLNTINKNVIGTFLTKDEVTVYDNTSGTLVPFGVLEKDAIYPIASDYGNWWRIIYLDRVGYVRKSEVEANKTTNYSRYNITLEDAVKKQMSVKPQTDVYNGDIYIRWDAFKKLNGTKSGVIKAGWNIRSGPGTEYEVIYTTKGDLNVALIDYERDSKGDKWWRITRSSLPTWINATYDQVYYYMNPNNFLGHDRYQFQFLDLSLNSGASATDLNRILQGKGILAGKGSAFIQAGLKHNVNDVYLVAHALLETGNGTSALAKGVEYNGKTVYNMYGIGAYDSCPLECGAKKAYEEGWTTPEKAIIGGAKFIGESYIHRGQNTLYKMRWNPAQLVNGSPTHQYATDIGWAVKQTLNIYNLYKQLDNYLLILDIPNYK